MLRLGIDWATDETTQQRMIVKDRIQSSRVPMKAWSLRKANWPLAQRRCEPAKRGGAGPLEGALFV